MSTSTCGGVEGRQIRQQEEEEMIAAAIAESMADVKVQEEVLAEEDVVVPDATNTPQGESDWDVVEQVMTLSHSSNDSPVPPPPAEVLNFQTTIVSPPVELATVSASSTALPPRGNGVFVEDVTVENIDVYVPAEPTPAPAPAPVVAPAPTTSAEQNQAQSFRYMWKRELDILAEMGFTDLAVIAPLLHEHLHTPSLLTSPRDGPSPDGMQRVIFALLQG